MIVPEQRRLDCEEAIERLVAERGELVRRRALRGAQLAAARVLDAACGEEVGAVGADLARAMAGGSVAMTLRERYASSRECAVAASGEVARLDREERDYERRLLAIAAEISAWAGRRASLDAKRMGR